MILVDSIYINDSGGKSLLDYFINTLIEKKLTNKFYFFLDSRGKYDYTDKIIFQIGYASEINRYIFYKKNKHIFSKIFCFGNVPPPLKCNVPVYTYFHNVLLAKTTKGLPLKSKMLKLLKRRYIRFASKNTNCFIVQTSYVKKMIEMNITDKIDIKLFPFFSSDAQSSSKESKELAFVYISNANPHKNHHTLLNAWLELKMQGYTPKLHLTITENHTSILKVIDNMINNGVDIENHGYVDVKELFLKTNYLIYPSLSESFGLGLVEAVGAGLNVIASDLPFVKEVIVPSLVFDPNSVDSIVQTTKLAITNRKIEKSKIVVENMLEDLILYLTD